MRYFVKSLKRFYRDENGLALIEGAMVLPLMFVLLFGLFDLGQALIINQKLKSATYTASDLITRKSYIDDTDIENAVGGAQMVIDPYDRGRLGIDIVGIEFNDDDSPDIIWRHTENMNEAADVLDDADGLGQSGEGVVAVFTQYAYTPLFSQLFIDNIVMEEVTYMRGRRTSVIRYNED